MPTCASLTFPLLLLIVSIQVQFFAGDVATLTRHDLEEERDGRDDHWPCELMFYERLTAGNKVAAMWVYRTG